MQEARRESLVARKEWLVGRGKDRVDRVPNGNIDFREFAVSESHCRCNLRRGRMHARRFLSRSSKNKLSVSSSVSSA
jgi:hypothetical protein